MIPDVYQPFNTPRNFCVFSTPPFRFWKTLTTRRGARGPHRGML